jgi:hypothetical protein
MGSEKGNVTIRRKIRRPQIATLRLQAEKEALAALCGGALDVAGARFIVGRIRRF